MDAVITQLGLIKQIVVAWSYSGRMLGDYLNQFGSANLAGVISVSATLKTKSEYFTQGMDTILPISLQKT